LVGFGFGVTVSDVCDGEAAAPVAVFEVLTAEPGIFVAVFGMFVAELGMFVAELEVLVAELGMFVAVLRIFVPVLGVPVDVVEKLRACTDVVPVGIFGMTAVLAPGSAKVVPKYGTKVEPEQQLPSYAQQYVPSFDAPLHEITFTSVLFPAMRNIRSKT
jgi:hypothetical protein